MQLRRIETRSGIFRAPQLLLAAILSLIPLKAETVCIIVTGLGGQPEYEENFLKWSDQLEADFRGRLQAEVHRFDGRSGRRQDILSLFDQVTASMTPEGELWVFLVGHANVNRDLYKFNIKGPDLTSADLKSALDNLGDRRAYLVAATNSSGFLIPVLSAENRVVVTATRTPSERFPPLFLSFFIEAVAAEGSDTDKDGRVSLLEAYLFSRGKVGEWFKDKGRLQTEHALLSDRMETVLGQKKKEGQEEAPPGAIGLLAGAAHLSTSPREAVSSPEARALLEERTRLERDIEDLKFRKGQLEAEEYYRQLEALLVKLAELNGKIEMLEGKGT